MPRFLRQLLDLWTQLGLNQKISLTLASFAVIGVMAGVLVWSSRPDLQPLNLGGALDPKDAGAIIAALDEKGVKYEISGGGGTILVPRDQVYKLRMELAEKGMFAGGTVGFEIFDKGNFGISDFVQRTNSLRAIQGELARTIGEIDGVRSARVMVVMPENRLLVTDSTRRSTASVLVDTGGNRLAPEAVNSIRSLVAYAVEGLKVDDVVVVDNRGNVLSEELRQDNLGAGLTTGQIRYRTGLEEYFSHKVESMLSTVLGPGNAVVRVSVDIDNTSSTTVEERYDPDTQVVRNSTTTEDSNISTDAHPVGRGRRLCQHSGRYGRGRQCQPGHEFAADAQVEDGDVRDRPVDDQHGEESRRDQAGVRRGLRRDAHHRGGGRPPAAAAHAGGTRRVAHNGGQCAGGCTRRKQQRRSGRIDSGG